MKDGAGELANERNHFENHGLFVLHVPCFDIVLDEELQRNIRER